MQTLGIKKYNLKKRLDILLPQFEDSIAKKNLPDAKKIITEIQPILKDLDRNARLIKLRNCLFELSMETNNYEYAIDGLLANRNLISKTTRLHLEATALLAICYLRKGEFILAQPYIKEVMQSDKIIKSETTKAKFNKEIINRFNEESVIITLRSEKRIGEFDFEEIYKQALLIEQTKDTDEIFSIIGHSLPKASKEMLLMVDDFSRKQLSYKEQKLLSAPGEIVKDEKAGKTVFSSFKRVLYKSICDPESEVYKAWYTNGIGAFCDKKLITGAVISSLVGLGVISITVLVIATVALLMRFGLDIYCDKYKPLGVMEIRGKK